MWHRTHAKQRSITINSRWTIDSFNDPQLNLIYGSLDLLHLTYSN